MEDRFLILGHPSIYVSLIDERVFCSKLLDSRFLQYCLLSRGGIENILKLQNHQEPCAVVLYTPWFPFCQATEASYIELAKKLAGKGVKVAKILANGDQKEFAKQELQLGSFKTILIFPKSAPRAIKYPSEHRDVDSVMSFVNLLQ